MGNGHVAAAARRLPPSGDAETERREFAVNLCDQKIGLRQRFRPKSGHPSRFGDELKRAQQWGQRENVRRADMHCCRAGGRFVNARHRETALGRYSPPTGESGREAKMTAVQVKPTWGAWAGVEPLVMGPEREIHAVAVEGVGHHADAVRAVNAEQHSPGVRLASEQGQVEQLAACEQHRRQNRQLDVWREGGDDVVGAQRATVSRRHEPEVRGGIKSPQPQVAAECVGVGREVERVAYDDAARRVLRLEESAEQLVKIGRGLAGNAYPVGRCTKHRGEHLCRCLRQGEPGWIGLGPAADAEPSPLVERAQQARFSPA